MRGKLIVGAIIAALFVAGCGGGGTTTVTVTKGADGSIQTAETTTSVDNGPPITPADIQINVVVTSKKCFGSAGCNYKYTLDPKYVAQGPRSLAPVTIVYTVTGGNQDQVGNMTMDAKGSLHFDRETSTQGEDGANFVATVTSVIPG